jgi:hypothetical protein
MPLHVRWCEARTAIKEKGMLSSMRIERSEIGTPGDFDHLSDEELERELRERFEQLFGHVNGARPWDLRPTIFEFLHDIPQLQGSQDHSRAFFLCAICEQPKQSMQDQEKQTRDQSPLPRYREDQCLRRSVVTYTLALHG